MAQAPSKLSQASDVTKFAFSAEDDVASTFDYALILNVILEERRGSVDAELAEALARLSGDMLDAVRRVKVKTYAQLDAIREQITSH